MKVRIVHSGYGNVHLRELELEEVPRIGESITVNDYRFRIADVDYRTDEDLVVLYLGGDPIEIHGKRQPLVVDEEDLRKSGV